MQLTALLGYDLLILVGCLVLNINSKQICKSNEYTVVTSSGSFLRCLTCPTCHIGRGSNPPCGSQIQHPPDVNCEDCPTGTFSAEYDSSPCHNCQKCAEHENVAEPCTNKSDRVCSGTCEKSYFFSKKDSTYSCQKCSYCCFDGKDEVVPECANQGLNASKQHCRPRADRDCSLTSNSSPTGRASGTEASKSTGIIIGVISSAVFVAVVLLVIVWCWCRRKKKVQGSVEEGTGTTSSALDYASKGPQTEPSSDTRVTFALPNEEKHHKDNLALEKSNLEQKHLEVASTPADELQSANDKVVKLPDVNKSRRPSFNRQGSKDSQNSGDGEVGFRKRSNSAISFEKLKRKLSERDGSLLEEDLDEIHEPIKVDKHPKSQKQKEGSRVEFKFKVQGTSSLSHQWFKDDEELPGQTNDNLVFECIQLRDFGHYKCHVNYEDGYGDIIESSSAFLDVIPQSLNGMRPKLLQEVDLNTRDHIASLLENKRYSLGGCRQVAAKYCMKEDKITSLDNSREPGKDVMEFLSGSKPNLTVYSFCKVLKEEKIERFDIAKLLEDHLLIRDGATYL